jgi:hypothetical protein
MNDAPAGGEMGEKESGLFQARLSNLPYYAATGVKPQAFVPILFYSRPDITTISIISVCCGHKWRRQDVADAAWVDRGDP